uniref:Pleckstrin homology domain containing O2 n=1 Tax=Sphenodon punctatus TaxID=8508 RepID=A0A8D0GYY3_SPHPU
MRGVKEESPEKPKHASTADKAGWIKKSSGGLLGLWRERYILLRKAQLLVYEDEDEQKCLETVELGSYDKCQDLRALLKRKNRFILIRVPGNKVHNIKFQAPSGEEKEEWMKALNEGINRGKNKILDEVKVDESLSLDHVTRGRVKVAQVRRPPTRTHLKEVAKVTSDGMLRLDLDAVDNGPPSFTSDISENATMSPPKETPKPPMPPTKPALVPDKQSEDQVEDPEESKLPSGDNPETQMEVTKSAPKPPVPPPKILSDKMKVGWDESAPEFESPDGLKPLATVDSKENLVEAVAKEAMKPPAPPPKVLSEKLMASMNSSQGGSEAKGFGVPQPDEAKLPVNGVQEGEAIDPVAREADSSAGDAASLPPRCASLGDLLSGPNEKAPLGQGVQRGPHLAQMEKKLACEQEKTEKLLQQVLHGDSERAPDGNGPLLNAESLLNEAVEQLRQATQVLQEIKDLGELGKEPTEKHREKQKDLVTLYRRSVP